MANETPAATPTTPPPPATVTLKIDGQTVVVNKGTNILEAAKTIGIEISYFCYHPGLSAPAVCRQCLVDVKGGPKPIPSCYTPVADNMEVMTSTPRVLAVRQQMLEFTLLNHPVDCPICDKSGECTLQKMYHEWDHSHSRSDVNKVHKPKKVDLGPTIVLDAERCILCTRCIRVCDEVAHEHQLEITNRGDRAVLSVAPGLQLDNPYSLNTVDVCPVGALTSKDFRFTMRAWELNTTQSICPGCSTGCNIEVHHAQGEVWRLVPRFAADVNLHWMCDEGRMTYHALSDGDRVVGASLGGDPAALDKAVAFIAGRVQAGRESGKLAFALSAQSTNEELFVAQKVARLLGARVYLSGRAPRPERADKILRTADVNPNTLGARILSGKKDASAVEELAALEKAIAAGEVELLYAVGEDLQLSPAALEKLASLDVIVQAVHRSALTEIAKAVLPVAAWAELDGTFTNQQSKVQRLRRAIDPRGGSQPGFELLLAVARKLDLLVDVPPTANARQVFAQMKAEVPEMAHAEWGRPQPLVQLRFAGSRG